MKHSKKKKTTNSKSFWFNMCIRTWITESTYRLREVSCPTFQAKPKYKLFSYWISVSTEIGNFLDESVMCYNFWDSTHNPLVSWLCLAAIYSKTSSGHLGSIILVPAPYRIQELPLVWEKSAPSPVNGISSVFVAAKDFWTMYEQSMFRKTQ